MFSTQRFLTFFILVMMGFAPVFAQRSIDLLTLSGQIGPNNSYENHQGSADEITGLASLKIPIVFNQERSIWYSQLVYMYSGVNSTATFGDSIAAPINLHGIIVQTGWVQKLGDGRALQLLFAPRFMMDGKGFGERTFQLGGVALFEKEYSPRLLMRYGAMFNQDLFGPMLIPLVYLDWNIAGSQWNVKGLLPINLKIGYRFNDRFSAGLSHFGLVTSYPLQGADYQGDYMERKSIDLTLFGRYRLFGNFYLEGRAGYALARDYAQYDGDDKLDFRVAILEFGEERQRKNFSFEDGFIGTVRVVYNLAVE